MLSPREFPLPDRRRHPMVRCTIQLSAALVCLQLAAIYALHDPRTTFFLLFAVSGLTVGFACRHFIGQTRRHFEAFSAAPPRQAMSTALLYSVMALLAAVVVIQLLLPLLDALTGQTLTRTYLRSSVLPLLPVAVAVLAGVTAGRRPVASTMTAAAQSRFAFPAMLPRGLVVFPFAVSIFLIATTLAVGALLSRQSTPCDSGLPTQRVASPEAGVHGPLGAPVGPARRAATRSSGAWWSEAQAPCPPANTHAGTVRSDTCLHSRASSVCTHCTG